MSAKPGWVAQDVQLQGHRHRIDMDWMQVLSTLVALHAGAVRLGVISPRVSPARGTQYKEVASVLLLNSLTLAIACRCG
jgi:hypothetical protein